MKKNIQMVALVGGQEIVVGQCHPGQARILRKNGLADWVKDKLVLGQSTDLSALLQRRDNEEAKNRYAIAKRAGWEPVEESTVFRKQFLFSGLDSLDDPISSHGRTISSEPELPQRPLTEVSSEDLRAWVKEIRDRQALGHTLLSCDNPRALTIGFVDHEDNIIFNLGLRKLKVSDEELEELKVERSFFSTSDGREKFLGAWGSSFFPDSSEYADVEVPEGLTLESLWMDEARTAVFEEGQVPEFTISKGALVVVEDSDFPSPPSPPVTRADFEKTLDSLVFMLGSVPEGTRLEEALLGPELRRVETPWPLQYSGEGGPTPPEPSPSVGSARRRIGARVGRPQIRGGEAEEEPFSESEQTKKILDGLVPKQAQVYKDSEGIPLGEVDTKVVASLRPSSSVGPVWREAVEDVEDGEDSH